jgi:hypothetical protein
MEKREPISISFCEKCGSKVNSRDEVCFKCGTLPHQDDRRFFDEFDEKIYPINEDGEWSELLSQKFDDWIEHSTKVNFCKDCGKKIEDIQEYDNDIINMETGEVITTNDHLCNPNSPIYP